MPADLPADSPSASPAPPSRRLRAGYHLFPAGDGWLLLRPDGVFVRLHLPNERLSELAEAFAEAFAEEAAEAAPPAPGSPLAELLDVFAERGLLAGAPILPALPLGRRIALDGEGPVAAALARLLEDEGFELRRLPPGAEPADIPRDVELVVCCAGWLPDARWQAIDELCHQRGLAWHGCHAEGNLFYLGPMRLPGDPHTARYADVRARRLAAETHPDGLEAYWRYAGSGRTPPVPWPDAGAVAVLAGALASDILAFARGIEPPSHGDQLAFDPARLGFRRHPVLPVPRGLMTEAAP